MVGARLFRLTQNIYGYRPIFPLPNPHPAKELIILLKFLARERGQIEVI